MPPRTFYTLNELHDRRMSELLTAISIAANFPLLKGSRMGLVITSQGNSYMPLQIVDQAPNEVIAFHCFAANGRDVFDPMIAYRIFPQEDGPDLWIPYIYSDTFGYREYAKWSETPADCRVYGKQILSLVKFGRTWASNIRTQQATWLAEHGVK